MYKINLLNINSGFNYAEGAVFETEQDAQEWLAKIIGSESPLMPEREVSISDEYSQDDVLEVIQEHVQIGEDEENNAIYELQDTKVRLKAQFTAEIVDISAQVAQEEINRQAKAFLAESDWKILRHIRQKALQQATTLTEEQYLALEQQRADAAASIIE